MQTRQRGFTLVEMAIVLVIIGLLLGGVLKGQELIASAKAKSLAADFRSIALLVYGYQDKYRAMPGDQDRAQLDAAFGKDVGTACTPANTAGHCATGNGRIDGNWDAATAADESFLFWQHVRLANLASGSTNTGNADYLPRNALGGPTGIEGNSATPYIAGLSGVFLICSGNVPGNLVRQIDRMLDDGETGSGSVRAVQSGAQRNSDGVASSAIVDATNYTICAAY